MSDALIQDLERDGFGHYLAGFIDGEGSFGMVSGAGSSRTNYGCRFAIQVRDDDAEILRECCRRTGIGGMSTVGRRDGTNPTAIWQFSSIPDCLRLIAILERFPLRAKKARDYEVWKRAVYEWSREAGKRGRDQSRMAALKEEMESVRRYQPGPPRVAAETPAPQQIALL